MKRAILKHLAAILVLTTCICIECTPLLLVLVAATTLCVGPTGSQTLVNLRKKEGPPMLRTPDGPKKKVDPPLL